VLPCHELIYCVKHCIVFYSSDEKFSVQHYTSKMPFSVVLLKDNNNVLSNFNMSTRRKIKLFYTLTLKIL
jgi:hypothetical protein